MIRLILIAIFLVLYLVVFSPALVVEWIIGKFNPEAKAKSSLWLVQHAFRFIFWLTGSTLEVKGRENIPDDRAVLYVSNHRSYFDIVVGYQLIKGQAGFVAKKELKRIWLLSHWMKNLHCLFLDRENPKEGLKTILQAIDYIKNGISICIFPEGTRNTGEELSLLPFHSGSFKIAEKTNCPIVPISMNNTISIFESHLPKVRKTHVILEYGDPIYPGDLDKDARRRLAPYCQNIIQETINRNQALL